MALNETIAQLEQRIEDLEKQIEELLDVDDDTPPVAPQIRTRWRRLRSRHAYHQ
jgi:hypothetical protein